MTIDMTNPVNRINEYELPLVPCMLSETGHDEDVFFIKNYLDELSHKSPMDKSAKWALETIAELQQMRDEALDKLNEIEAIIDKVKPDYEKGKDLKERMMRKDAHV